MDDRLRYVCESCHTIHYQNPNVIVGCLATWQGKILLCKRAIEPRIGKWTLPAGFMENGETTLEGAQRETLEEAGASFSEAKLYREFDIPSINQIYLFYLAELDSGKCQAGIESLEVGLFDEKDIPWGELAFPVMSDILKEYLVDQTNKNFPVRFGEPNYHPFKK